MRFALVGGDKTEAQPGLRGSCVHCQSDMIAYCGAEKVWHWKHKRKSLCDPWWENEAEWHREWKKHFPKEWQELGHFDSMNEEKHIADVKTISGLVIEFQHSAIDSDEIKSRENFYKNMVWLVNGTRLSMDYRRFCKGSNDFHAGSGHKDFGSSIWKGIYFTYFPEECFPKRWLESSVPVYFDFQGIPPVDQADERRSFLWCLFPGDMGGWAVVASLSRKDFVECALNNSRLLLAQDILSHMDEQREKEKQQAEEQKWRENQRAEAFRQLMINPKRGRYRRVIGKR
ncbi:MAG: competence protein [Candidatus Omnitrophica bacterium]|nr:competence protein [Candidatus Omnitrophota bacterium]